MREIKFKFYDKIKNNFFTTDDMCSYEVWDCIDDGGDDNRFKAMQFTGLKDKKGVEIYEGDIVSGGVSGGKPVAIEWSCIRRWSGMADGYRKNHIGFNFDEYYFRLEQCEVIGNIHQNPELLENKK